MNSPAVQITALKQVFSASSASPVRAVDGVDLRIERGEIIALLGANGAGKTTMLDIVLGLTTPTEGSVQLFGSTPSEAVAAGRVSAVLQTGGLLGDLKVGETVHMIASLYQHSLAPKEAMARAGISELANRRVSKCSGGEQQRLRFALALLPEPELLILDEPTAGMDVNARHAFWDTMRQEARDGRTIIFATHYLQEAEDFAQRIVMLNRGKIIADGPVAEIRELTGRKRVTLAWPGASEADLARIPGAEDIERSGERIHFLASDADAAASYLLNETTASNLEITAAGLDSVFTNLTSSAGSETGSAAASRAETSGTAISNANTSNAKHEGIRS